MKTRFHIALYAIGAAALLASSATATHADVKYTTEMKVDNIGGGGGRAGGPRSATVTNTTAVKGNRERVESTISAGPIEIKSVTLTLCEKQQTIKLDPDLKIYTVGPIGGLSFGMPAMPRFGPPGRNAPEPAGQPGEGKIVTTVSVQDLGNEKIGDLMTHHSMVTMHEQTSGCIGERDTTNKMEVWVGSVRTFFCPERAAASRTETNERGCKITYEMKGDVDAMKEAFGGMIVQMKIYKDDKVAMVQTLKDYSQSDLDDALFSVPADYKEVSAQEFGQQEQQAMIKRIMDQRGGR